MPTTAQINKLTKYLNQLNHDECIVHALRNDLTGEQVFELTNELMHNNPEKDMFNYKWPSALSKKPAHVINNLNKDHFTKESKHQGKKIHICLLNIPCSGFGDIINCSSFYQYLKLWYPGILVTICTTEINKFKSLGIKGIKFVELIPKNKSLKTECGNYDN